MKKIRKRQFWHFMWDAGDALTLVIKNLCLQQKAAPGERPPGLPMGEGPRWPGTVSTLSQLEDAAAGREEQAEKAYSTTRLLRFWKA